MPPATSLLDAVAAAAVDLARDAALEEVPQRSLGEHVGVEADGERVVTHLFDCLDPGYRGWRWAVQLTRASRAKTATVINVARIAGPDSVLAPPWVPYSERLRPGDVGIGDLLPAAPDDERLTLAIHDDDLLTPFFEQGVGRARMLSHEGRVEAAERWYDGDRGPDTPIAQQAPAPCATCAFWVPLRGSLGQAFGACTNEWAPDDARVVSVDHGCGAHSEGGASQSAPDGVGEHMLDEVGFDLVADDAAPTGEVGTTDADTPATDEVIAAGDPVVDEIADLDADELDEVTRHVAAVRANAGDPDAATPLASVAEHAEQAEHDAHDDGYPPADLDDEGAATEA